MDYVFFIVKYYLNYYRKYVKCVTFPIVKDCYDDSCISTRMVIIFVHMSYTRRYAKVNIR